jgi:predicted dehydrogenase
MKSQTMHRRTFLNVASRTALGAMVAPLFCPARLVGGETANAKLDIACIGLGGQMHSLMKELATFEQNVVAICDLDENRMAATRTTIGGTAAKAKGYKDYRELLEREKSADAVMIASPDHWHAILSKGAIQAGKHVYCEKPLTHTVGEARQIGALARQAKVITQTGNQGSGSSNFRRSIELIQAGLLGVVRDVHIWHPPHGWPSGVGRPAGADPIPAGFDWNSWIGPAPMRPYKAGVYHPGAWRGWYDFGGGSLADFCCHAFSMPVRALDLDYPTRIEVESATLALDSFPKSCKVHFSFPARGTRGPVAIHFYTGGDMPDREVTAGMVETFGNVPTTGCLVVGEKGMLSAGLWNSECHVRLRGDKEFRHADSHDAARKIPRLLPRAPKDRHVLEWIEACKGGPKTFSPFEIGAHVTEVGASGLIALRLGRAIDWDGPAMRAKGVPTADVWIEAQHRAQYAL